MRSSYFPASSFVLLLIWLIKIDFSIEEVPDFRACSGELIERTVYALLACLLSNLS
jgi:hypothetical protein